MNIALIGYRGTGKSTIGKHLAGELRMEFVDADVLLAERAGRTIKEIFETEGELGFRDRESAILKELAARENHVIAAGGGAVLRADNVAALRGAGTVVWLQADAETLHGRIVADAASRTTRPNLTALGGLAEVAALLAARMPLYRAAAHVTVDVSALSVAAASAAVARLVRDQRLHYGTK